MSPEAPKKSFRKYTEVERKRVYPRAIQLFEAGLSTSDIRERLDKEGLCAPGGARHADKPSVVNTILTRYRAGLLDAYIPTGIAGGKSGRLPDTCMGILTDPTLSDTQKIKMLIAYAQVE